MRFEYRVLILLSLVIVGGFTFMNFVSIVYVREVVEEQLRAQAQTYSKLLLYNRTEKIPEYMRVTETPAPAEGYSVILYTGKHYVFVRNDYVRKRVTRFALSLLLWEAGLVVMILSLFYLTLIRNLRSEREVSDLMSVLLQSLTHKIGNFIASQRVNLELLEESAPKERLYRSLVDLEKSYHRTFTLLETLRRERNVRAEKVDLERVVGEAISYYADQGKNLRFIAAARVPPVRANPVYVELLISLLLENAVKYSRGAVHVKLCRSRRGGPLLLIRNDIGTHRGGTGVGLQIARFVADKVGAELRIRIKGRFMVVVAF